MSKVDEDLKNAFAGESQASRKYWYWAKKADDEGFPQVAKLFRAASLAETVHANNHLKAMGGIQSTAENLKAAVGGEHYEVVSMYPEFIQDAETEQNKKALNSFKWAFEAEKVHEQLYRAALETLGSDTTLEDYYVCPVCGHTHRGSAPEKCPVCGTPGTRFERVS